MDKIIERQVKLLEDKFDNLQQEKIEAVNHQLYEKAAEIRDDERKLLETLFEKDPTNERVIKRDYFKNKFIEKYGFSMIDELASEEKVSLVFNVTTDSEVRYTPENFQETIGDVYGITEKEWDTLCLLYNETNKIEKTYSTPIDIEKLG